MRRGYFPPPAFFMVKLPLPLLTFVYPPKELLGPDFWCRRAALTPLEERLLLLPLPRLQEKEGVNAGWESYSNFV